MRVDVRWGLCGDEEENLQHFLFECLEFREERRKTAELQKPYEESKEFIGKILFDRDRSEEKKHLLDRLWVKRKRKVQDVTNS